ncbi:MAG: winged helix-turn-helix transcriptional regulator [archaeon]
MALKDLEEAMILSPRDKIYATIAKNPGLHFREVQRRTGIATGAMQYHIDYLQKKAMISEKKEGKFSRFYPTGGTQVNTDLMNLLRQDSVRKIILFLMNRRKATLKNISKEVMLSPSTTNFHMQKLLLSGVVGQKETSGKTYFSIKDKEPIIEVLVNYRETFLDTLVDNFVDLWEQDLK